MVFFNYATMQMAAKIVYYGPGLCGKTTNLHHIYTKTSPQSRGEMVSLETETDRTLFFDLLPIDVGVIGGFKTRLQLYTVPGQVFYNTTRKLVLKGVDGIVFVVDSQRAMLEANVESFKNLRENLAEIGLNLEDLPVVVQLNKRDLPNLADTNAILDALDPERKYESVESIASNGTGVFETLKLISKLTLRTLRRRMTGDEPVKTAPRKLAEVASFRVKEEPAAPARTVAGSTPLPHPPAVAPQPAPTFTTPVGSAQGGAAAQSRTQPIAAVHIEEPEIEVEEIGSAEPSPEPPASTPAELAAAPVAQTPQLEPDLPEEIFESEPPTEQPAAEEPPPVAEAALEAPAPEPEVDFGELEKPSRAAVKHVKVRSSVDIMAELEALRKRATQGPPKSKKEVAAELTVAPPKPKRDLKQTIVFQANPAMVPNSKLVRVTVSFENDGNVLDQHEQTLELEEDADVRSLSLDIKVALE